MNNFLKQKISKLIIVVIALVCPFTVFSATLTVTNNNDSGQGSLRNIIEQAQWGDDIVVNLPENSKIILNSTITFCKSINIDGKGVTIQVVSPGISPYRVFDIEWYWNLTMNINFSNFTIVGGKLSNENSVSWGPIGAGLVVPCNTNMTLTNVIIKDSKCTVTDDYSYCFGGGLVNMGNLTMNDCKITNCSSDCDASAISNYEVYNGETEKYYPSKLTLNNCTLTDNTVFSKEQFMLFSPMTGGVIRNAGTSTIVINECNIYNNKIEGNKPSGNLTIINSNLDHNTSGSTANI